jgi:hypothetical protein
MKEFFSLPYDSFGKGAASLAEPGLASPLPDLHAASRISGSRFA